MKMYSTTTSERASKSQGGNDYLDIEVLGSDRRKFLELNITIKNGYYHINGYITHPEHKPDHRSEQYFSYEVKS